MSLIANNLSDKQSTVQASLLSRYPMILQFFQSVCFLSIKGKENSTEIDPPNLGLLHSTIINSRYFGKNGTESIYYMFYGFLVTCNLWIT